ISSGECNGESSRPQNSVKGLSNVQPSSSLNKQNEVEAVKAANDSLPASLTTPTENGCTDNYKNGYAHSNGVKEATTDNIDAASLPLFNNEGGLSNQFPSLELQNREQNGRVDDLSASKVKGELQKCLNGPVTVSTVLLPRGLINSGNLCFLNATLQALLSCSPFVQLLQELRTRKVPKAGLALGELRKENNFLRSLWPVTNPPSSQEHLLHPQFLQKPLHPFLARG
ncbi:ubiquitin carboxyl-terminal hydrolase 24-like, partial [Prunus avium]